MRKIFLWHIAVKRIPAAPEVPTTTGHLSDGVAKGGMLAAVYGLI